MKNLYLDKLGTLGHLIHRFILFSILFLYLSYNAFKHFSEEEAIYFIKILLPNMGNQLFDFWVIGIVIFILLILISSIYFLSNLINNNNYNLLIDFFKKVSLDILYVAYTISISILSLFIVVHFLYPKGLVDFKIIVTYLFLIGFVLFSACTIYIFEEKFERMLMGLK